MNKEIDTLLSRLSRKGLIPAEVPRLVRDVLIIVSDAEGVTLSDINQRLEVLGWDQTIMDYFTFELIKSLTKEGRGFRAEESICM